MSELTEKNKKLPEIDRAYKVHIDVLDEDGNKALKKKLEVTSTRCSQPAQVTTQALTELCHRPKPNLRMRTGKSKRVVSRKS